MKCITYVFIFLFLFFSCLLKADTFLGTPEEDFIDPDTVVMQVYDCDATASFCLDISLSAVLDMEIYVDGEPYSGTFSGCDFDTTVAYTYSTLFGQGNLGPYMLTSWEVGQEVYSGQFNDIPDLVDSMNVWDPMGNWELNATAQLIVGGNPDHTYGEMDVIVMVINSPSYIGLNYGIEARGARLEFEPGRFQEVVFIEGNSGCTDTLYVGVACPTPAIVDHTITVGEVDTFCLSFSELLGFPQNMINMCEDVPEGNVQFSFLNCIVYTGLEVGVDSACIRVCDEFGICDTTYLMVTVLGPPGMREVFDTIGVGEGVDYCFGPGILPGDISSIQNICPEMGGTYANIELDTQSLCLSYYGLEGGGTDQACIIACDDLGFCDTTLFFITVKRFGSDFIYDTLYVNTSASVCLDTTVLNGVIMDIRNDCAEVSGVYVDFFEDISLCVDYDALEVGTDTACIILTDDSGALDTSYLIITVLPPPAQIDVIADFIMQGSSQTYCMDTSELNGPVTEIYNICSPQNGESVIFGIDNANICVNAVGVEAGTDTACIVICDATAFCDTSYFLITVVPPLPPQTSDDVVSTPQNVPITINVFGNDQISGSVTSFEVIEDSDHGQITITETGIVEYTPEEEDCGHDDSFTYEVCTSSGCDTAQVVIIIECVAEEFKIFNAFSPNGDGVNDYFRIQGIAQFPNHTLTVFNRWGNQVYFSRDYGNNWDGEWKGTQLPDGTYFYVFEDGVGNNYSGYLQISR